MRVVRDSRLVSELIDLLVKDLDREDIIGLARMPEPKVEEKYREVLKRIYESVGMCMASVWIEFTNGSKRFYVFLIRANIIDGMEGYLSNGGTVEGYLVEVKGKEISHINFTPFSFSKVTDAFIKFDEVGDKYRKVETKVVMRRALEKRESEELS
ncbi:MAG: hypothetical protein ACP5GU_04990 [Thermoprotei archaeon]